nr:DNA-binding protein HEXBP-like [Nicotiana tomentosiformis]
MGRGRGRGRAQPTARAAVPAVEPQVELGEEVAANVARRVEMDLAQGSGQGSDKKPRHSGGFSGTSSGGRGTYGRGHPPWLFHSALQGQFHGQQPQQPRSCYTCGDPRHIARFCPRTSGAKFDEVVDSARQLEMVHTQEREEREATRSHGLGNSSGIPSGGHYSGSRGPPQYLPPLFEKGCFECGDLGHMKRNCPRLSGGPTQQRSQAVAPAPVN